MWMIAAVALIVLAVALPLLIRPSSLPPPIERSPTQHLEDRKAAIYENLRDLHGEYRMGKLSDEDYQQTKRDLQKELAGVLREIEQILAGEAPAEPEAAADSPGRATGTEG